MIRLGVTLGLGAALLYLSGITLNPRDIQHHVEVAPELSYGGIAFNHPVFRLGFAGLAVLCLLALRPAWHGASRFAIALAALAAASTLWSLDPMRTLGRALDLAVVAVLPMIALAALGPVRAAAALWLFGVGVIAVSLALVLMGSPLALMDGHHAGAWRGVFTHKNAFGPFAATVLVLTLALGHRLPVPGGARAVAATLCLFALAGSQSLAAMLASAAAVAVLAVLWVAARTPLHWPLMLASAALAAAGILVLAMPLGLDLAAGMGRSPDFSGRTALWSAALPFTLSAPLGYGYGTAGGTPALEAMQQARFWLGARSAHNGVLALALDLGWGAALAYGLWLVRHAVVWRPPAPRRQPWRHALAAVAVVQGVVAMAESGAGPYPSYTLCALLVLVALSRVAEPARPMAASAPATNRSAIASIV